MYILCIIRCMRERKIMWIPLLFPLRIESIWTKHSAGQDKRWMATTVKRNEQTKNQHKEDGMYTMIVMLVRVHWFRNEKKKRFDHCYSRLYLTNSQWNNRILTIGFHSLSSSFFFPPILSLFCDVSYGHGQYAWKKVIICFTEVASMIFEFFWYPEFGAP